MKILLTGGGTGGHVYPLFAVAEAINAVVRDRKILDVKLYFMSDSKYNESAVFNNGLIYSEIRTGKLRRYFSLLNITDLFKTGYAVAKVLIKMFFIYPDVVFAKGGYVSFPALFAARILRIPVILHESDSQPGRVNRWASRFAYRIAVSYPDAAQAFPAEVRQKIAFTGNPIRTPLHTTIRDAAAYTQLGLAENTPTLLILGGSLGSQKINETLLEALPELLKHFQILHQTGANNIDDVKKTAALVLDTAPDLAAKYRPVAYFNEEALVRAAGVADIIISRAGSTIFEIALWGKPSIIIPIPEEVSHDQKKNSYSYYQAGACVVMEEGNLTPHLLTAELIRLWDNPAERQRMAEAARAFARIDAAAIIAKELVDIGYSHQK